MTTEELTQRIVELDERTIRHGEQLKTAFNQIEDVRALTGSVHELATSVRLLTETQKTTERKIDGLARDVDELKQKPARNWESTVRTVFELVLAAVVALVLVKIGLK